MMRPASDCRLLGGLPVHSGIDLLNSSPGSLALAVHLWPFLSLVHDGTKSQEWNLELFLSQTGGWYKSEMQSLQIKDYKK